MLLTQPGYKPVCTSLYVSCIRLFLFLDDVGQTTSCREPVWQAG